MKKLLFILFLPILINAQSLLFFEDEYSDAVLNLPGLQLYYNSWYSQFPNNGLPLYRLIDYTGTQSADSLYATSNKEQHYFGDGVSSVVSGDYVVDNYDVMTTNVEDFASTNDGTFQNGMESSQPYITSDSILVRGFDADGSDDYILAPDADSIKSFSAWIRPNTASESIIEFGDYYIQVVDSFIVTNVSAAEIYINGNEYELSDNLALNGDFEQDSLYWVVTGETTISNGRARILSTAGALSRISQAGLNYEVGDYARWEYSVVEDNGGFIATDNLAGYITQMPKDIKNVIHGLVINSNAVSIKRGSVVDVSIGYIKAYKVLNVNSIKITPSAWNFVTVTSNTAWSTSTNTPFKVSTNYFDGRMDYIIETNRVMTLSQHKKIYENSKRKFNSFPYEFIWYLY